MTSEETLNHPGPPEFYCPVTGGNLAFQLEVKRDYCVLKQPCLHTSMSNKGLKRVKIASDVAVLWILRPQPPGRPPAA